MQPYHLGYKAKHTCISKHDLQNMVCICIWLKTVIDIYEHGQLFKSYRIQGCYNMCVSVSCTLSEETLIMAVTGSEVH